MQTPADYDNLVWESQGQSAGWGRSAWDYVEVIDAGPEKVHFRVQFTRYRGGRQRDRQLPVALHRDTQGRPMGDRGPFELGGMTRRTAGASMPFKRSRP